MLIVVMAAWLYPDGAKRGGWMHAELLGKLGIALLFFLNGAMLPRSELRRGASAIRSHLLIQGFTFVAFPLLGLLLLWISRGHVSPALGDGLFFLCALPTTVTSAVALTSAANGNVPLAIFNSSLSSLLGVMLTPLWLSIVLGLDSRGDGLGAAVGNLALLLLLPLVLGQAAQRWLGGFIREHQRAAKLVDRGVILLLVHAAFCNAFADGVWSDHGWSTLVVTFSGALLLFALLFRASSWSCRRLGLDEVSRRAVVLCASQKSLAIGVPLAQLFFGATPEVAVIVLPILIYHPLQLAVSAWIVGRWLSRAELS
jgi:sodium/bile acid cotransporter 7